MNGNRLTAVLTTLALLDPLGTTAGQFSAKPAALATTYQTEHAWAVGAIAADIAEMAALAARQPKPSAVPAPAGVTPWSPDLFVAFAEQRLGPAPAKAPVDTALPPQYRVLTDLTAAALARASATVSAALNRNMRSASAHESAALVIGAFGLREAAGRMNDVRWSLNRMTAHLAMAAALRHGASAPTTDGRLAGAALLALSNRDASTLAALSPIAEAGGDRALAAWTRSLRIRVTQDWRLVPQPAQATRIEKLEYLRARRMVMSGTRAGQELTNLSEAPAADIARIVQSFPWSVEDGNDFVRPGLEFELVEIADAHRLVRGRPLPSDLPAPLMNTRAGRLVTDEGPQVLPWGAWAEFFQRHVGNQIGQLDIHLRRMLGLPLQADDIKRTLDQQFGYLTLYPVATAWRTKGRGTEADLTYIKPSIDLAVRAPELITYEYWAFLELGSQYERVDRGMPRRAAWFALPTAAVPYEAGVRTVDTIGAIPIPALEALVTEASSDLWLISRAFRPRPKNQTLLALLDKTLAGRRAYDVWAIDVAVGATRDAANRITWRRSGCSLSVRQCLELAYELRVSGDEAGAVAEYERVFTDPALDQVTMSNASSWLVSYYERSRQLGRALDLAERSGAVGSSTGITTLARLYERRGRTDDARVLYEKLSSRYERSGAELIGFYYRQAVVGRRTSDDAAWKAALGRLFPRGLRPMPAAMPTQPAKGVFVYKDSGASRRLRLQAGDIIIGLDGWLVEDKEQYLAVMAFADEGVKHKITAWRGVLFTVEAFEYLGMDLENHPLVGWIK